MSVSGIPDPELVDTTHSQRLKALLFRAFRAGTATKCAPLFGGALIGDCEHGPHRFLTNLDDFSRLPSFFLHIYGLLGRKNHLAIH